MNHVRLPILALSVREQRYSCHGCGNCCRDFTVQLRAEDLRKIEAQSWKEKLGREVTIEFRGQTFLRQREDGACVFLLDNGLCRIHAEFGFEAKPIACQLFPFHLTPSSRGIEMGLNFACQSVLENKGAELKSHATDLSRMAAALAEVGAKAPPPMLNDRLRASERETASVIEHVDQWLRRTDIDLSRRIDGLAWVVSALAKAKLENVREARLRELLDVLFGALPEELEHHPLEPATPRQQRMLRQAVFARTEDPKLSIIEKQGRLRMTVAQLLRSRRFKSGRGVAPRIGVGWPENIRLNAVENVAGAIDSAEQAAIADLMTRYLRASALGGRYWGAGYYGWSMIGGLQALLLNIACVGWLARLHAAGEQRDSITIIDVRAALGRIDRTAGRAKWLGSSAERLRLAYLNIDDGLRRLNAHYALVA